MLDHSDRGMALIAVLWISMLLAVIAAGFMKGTRIEVTLARNALENAKAGALADGGVNMAIFKLLHPPPELEAPPRFSARLEKLFEERPEIERTLLARPELQAVMLEQPPYRRTETFTFPLGEGRVLVEIEDEAGKIDLNHAPGELLQGLLEGAGLDGEASAALVDAIADYRDLDGEPRPRGAEDEAYAAAGLPWGAKDGPFAMVEELRQVLGMSAAIFERVAPSLTVYSGTSGINPWTAPREVLLALPGTTVEQVETLLLDRESGLAAAALAALPWLADGDDLIDLTESTAYTVRAEARTASGALFVREAVILLGEHRDGLPYAFVDWRRGRKRDHAEPPYATDGLRP